MSALEYPLLFCVGVSVWTTSCIVDFPEPVEDGSSSTTTGSGGDAPKCSAPMLAEAALALGARESVVLETTGLTSDLITTNPQSGNLLKFGYKGVWDPNTCQAFFIGGTATFGNIRVLAYDGEQNAWSQGADPTWICDVMGGTDPGCGMEAVGLTTFDPANGKLYVFKDQLREVTVTRPLGAQWSPLPFVPFDTGASEFSSIEFFPERNAIVYLAYGSDELWELKTGEPSWRLLKGSIGVSNQLPGYSAYSRKQKAVMFRSDGSDPAVRLLREDGSIEQLSDAPMGFKTIYEAEDGFKILAADPATGDFLAITHGTSQVYSHDLTTNAWSLAASLAAPDAAAAIPVETFGVTLILTDEDPPKMIVYKHG